MAASKKPKLSKTPYWGPLRGPQKGILLSLASLRLPFCIVLDIFQQMPMPFWLQYFSRNSNTLSSNILMEFPTIHVCQRVGRFCEYLQANFSVHYSGSLSERSGRMMNGKQFVAFTGPSIKVDFFDFPNPNLL